MAGKTQQPARLDPQGPLWATVERLLRKQHSPEQIAGILRNMHPEMSQPCWPVTKRSTPRCMPCRVVSCGRN
ncbi:MAG: hypothetical protein VB125_03925 [Burkholderia sp.]